MPSPGRIVSGDFQHDFESAARGNFPLSQATLIPLYRELSAKVSHVSLLALPAVPDTADPLLKGYRLVRVGDGERRICGPPTVYLEADRRKLMDRASYYNDLHAACPTVHFYVFPVLSAADWCTVGGLYGDGSKKHLVGDRYAREFRTLLDPAIGYAWAAEDCSFQEAISCYYRTDHHWNFPGAYKVYRQLWRFLHPRSPQMGPPWEPKGWIEIPGVTFHGSSALRAGRCDSVGDAIVDGDFDLPEVMTRIHGFEGIERNAKRCYHTGDYDKAEFTNHYAVYFGKDYGLIEYTSDGAGGGNLAVIGDSFDNCIEPLLASHFAHTWFVDLRLYAKDVGEEFDMDTFLRQHEITDVLFLGTQSWVLGFHPMEPYPVR